MASTYLTIQETADRLRMAKGTLYNWVNQKKIPCYKRGGKLLFDEEKIQAWLSRRERKVRN